MALPTRLLANAWFKGHPAGGTLEPTAGGWATDPLRVAAGAEAEPILPERGEEDLADWTDDRVGWGLVLPAVAGDDRPTDLLDGVQEPFRRLWEERSQIVGWEPPVFRVSADPAERLLYLRDRRGEPVSVHHGALGVKEGCVPLYLLLCGGPDAIPWVVQYWLNATRCVGRLHLPTHGLDRYVDALLDGWAGSRAAPDRSVVWSACQPGDVVGEAMHDVLAAPIAANLRDDPDLAAGRWSAHERREPATASALAEVLRRHQPAVVVTTSHGFVEDQPTDDVATLGLPVDEDGSLLSVRDLAGWSPDGAIWLAHACCSAGADGESSYTDVFAPDSELHQAVAAVAAGGARQAALPTALLGAERPLGAFIGQVEMTFDWSIRDPVTGQATAAGLVSAIHPKLYYRKPVGLSLRSHFAAIGSLMISYDRYRSDYANQKRDVDLVFYAQLAARDCQSTVLLGDPTVTLPAR